MYARGTNVVSLSAGRIFDDYLEFCLLMLALLLSDLMSEMMPDSCSSAHEQYYSRAVLPHALNKIP